MTTTALPATTTSAPDHGRRRPRMRPPAYEPEPVGYVPRAAHAGPDRHPAGEPGAGRPSEGDPPGNSRSAAGTSGNGSRSGPGGADRAGAPDDVRPLATALVRTMVEVLAGRRAPAHLGGLARPEVVRYLTASRTAGAGTPPSAPRRVHVARPGPDAAEVVAVCRVGTRFRALTVRLDRTASGRGQAWCATAARLL